MPRIGAILRPTDSGDFSNAIIAELDKAFGSGSVQVGNVDGAILDAIVVFIGSRFLGADGFLQLVSDPDLLMLAAALQGGTPVLPIILNDARLPQEAELPQPLKPLARKQPVEFRSRRLVGLHSTTLVARIKAELEFSTPQFVHSAPGDKDRNSETSSLAPPLGKVSAPETRHMEERNRPEIWLQRMSTTGIPAATRPLVIVSYASEDLSWVRQLQAFLELQLAELRDVDGHPYEAWHFSDAKRGTALGDEFPIIVAEKMWSCRAAVVVLSKDYFSSEYCREIELPFLLWRREHDGLGVFPIRLGALPVRRTRIPEYISASRTIVLDDLIDDRQAPADFATSAFRDFNLRQLKEQGIESEIERRFDGISRQICTELKAKYSAIEVHDWD